MEQKINNIFILNTINIRRIVEVTEHLQCEEYLTIMVDWQIFDRQQKYPVLVVQNKPSVSWLRVKKVFFLTSIGWIERECCEAMIEDGYDFHSMNDAQIYAHRIDHKIVENGVIQYKGNTKGRRKIKKVEEK